MPTVYSIQPTTVFVWFMLVLVVRRVILVVMLIVTRLTQPFQASAQPPEDNIRKKGRNQDSIHEQPQTEFNRDKRINRIIGNDAENDAYFLILYMALVLFSDSFDGNAIRTIAYGSVYAFARIVHSFAYLAALQPLRSMAYILGLMCTLAINIDLVIFKSRQTN